MKDLVPQDSFKILLGEDLGALTNPEFFEFHEFPPEAEWFANLRNEHTKRAYRNHVTDFMRYWRFEGKPVGFRIVQPAHVKKWRDYLENERGLAASTVRTKLSALSSLFDQLVEGQVMKRNPVPGVKRPGEGSNEGKTPAISDWQMQQLLAAPDPEKVKTRMQKLKAYRDRAILSTFAFHGLRCSELTGLKVKDIQERRGVKHFQVHGKREKIRYVPAHPSTIEAIEDYLDFRGTREREEWLFLSVRDSKLLAQSNVFRNVIRHYSIQAGINPDEFCVHSLRATAGTNALENGADIEQVQEWFGHANISTTRLYDKRVQKVEDSPTFRVKY